MSPDASYSESPFPDARSQVRRMRPDTTASASRSAGALPLESSIVPWERGWMVRLPVRVERVEVDKQVVVHQRLVVRREQIEDVARVNASVRREQVRVEFEGDSNLPS